MARRKGWQGGRVGKEDSLGEEVGRKKGWGEEEGVGS